MNPFPAITGQQNKIAAAAAAMAQRAGLRMTRQRRAVIKILLESCDHPTAAQIYERAKGQEPGISLATVYNCLETLAKAKMVNELHFHNAPAKFCPNVTPHVHLFDAAANTVIDVQLKPGLKPEDVFDLPEGTCITGFEACLHGRIPESCISTHQK